MVLTFLNFVFFLKKDKENARAHLVYFLVLALLPLIPILISLILEFSQSGLHSLHEIEKIFYPAGGKAYAEFLPVLLEELKKILKNPSYIIPYD